MGAFLLRALCGCDILQSMTTITIPENLTRESNLIAVPYEEYRRFLGFIPKKEIVLSPPQKNRLKTARKNLSNGKFLTLNELRKKLEAKN